MVLPESLHRRSGIQRAVRRMLSLVSRRRTFALKLVWCVSLVGLWLLRGSHRSSHRMHFYSEPKISSGFGLTHNSSQSSNSRPSHSVRTETVRKESYAKNTRIVVSFKTIPSRIQHIDPVLESLLDHQSIPLDKLYVVLPKTKWMNIPRSSNVQQINRTNHYEVPAFLTHRARHDPRLEILFPEHDYGPIDKMLYALQREQQTDPIDTADTVLIYVDDDVVYHPDLLQTLVAKGNEYPHSAVALSGCHLRSRFRKISHKLPRYQHDVPPNLYYLLSSTASVPRDEEVDVVQGFTGVLIRPSFFDLQEFEDLICTVTKVGDVWKSDDFVISGYLAHRNITLWVVVSQGWGTLHKPASTKDNLGAGMHRQVMRAAVELQARLGIWQSYSFLDFNGSPEDYWWRLLVDCENGLVACPSTSDGKRLKRKDATKLLDEHFG